jgi:hypothetical protein
MCQDSRKYSRKYACTEWVKRVQCCSDGRNCDIVDSAELPGYEKLKDRQSGSLSSHFY